MIFCNQCGNLVIDDARSCSECVAEIPQIPVLGSSMPHRVINSTPKADLDLNVGRTIVPIFRPQSKPSPASETVESQFIKDSSVIPVGATSSPARSPLSIIVITVGMTVCVLALGFIAIRAWINGDKGSNNRNTESATLPSAPTSTTRLDRLPSTSPYVTYRNSDFDFSIEYPADILFPFPDSQGPTGERFSSRDGQAELVVVGLFNRPGETAEESYNSTLADYSRKGRTVTYKVLRQDWYVISGFDGDRVFYEKTIFNSGMIKLFRFEWPESQRSIYEQITTRISKSFTG